MARTTDDPEHARMSFGEHLEELRKRIFSAMYIAVAGVVICFYFRNQLMDIVVQPYRWALWNNNLPDQFTYARPAEAVITYLTMAFQAGLILTSPWIIWQIWKFVAAGLFPRERKIVYRYVGPSVLLFLAGVAFFYFLVLPLTLNFFIGFTKNTAGPTPQPTFIEKMLGGHHGDENHFIPVPLEQAVFPPIPILPGDPPEILPTPPATVPATTLAATTNSTTAGAATAATATTQQDVKLYYNATDRRLNIRIGKDIFSVMVVEQGSLFANLPSLDDYLGFVAFTGILFGVAFELPMVVMILAQTGLVEVQTFRGIRKYAYFGILIASVIAAPSSDPTTLFALVIPLVALYEFGIVLGAIVVGRQKTREEAEERAGR